MSINLKEQLKQAQEKKLQSMGNIGQRAAEAEAKVQALEQHSVAKADYNLVVQERDAEKQIVQTLKSNAPKKPDGSFFTDSEIQGYIATIATIAKKANGAPYSQKEVDDLVKAHAPVAPTIKDANGNTVDQAAFDALVAAQANTPVAPAIKDANGNAVDQAAYNTLVTGQKTDVENYKLQLFAFMETKANGVYPANVVGPFKAKVCSGNVVLTEAKNAIPDIVFDLDMFCEKSVVGLNFDPNNI